MVTALHSNQAVKGFACASGETTLTDTSATFHTYMVGWQIVLDMEFPVALTITARPSATTLKVAGDVRTLTDPGKFYILFAPPWVNPANGTLAEVITEGEDVEWDVLTKGSLFLWAGYRYQPPMVGFNDGGTTVGAQAGTNKLGNYHCNNRVYSIQAGRWLSPDQAARPGWNLNCYAFGNPIVRTDPTGLLLISIMGTGQDEHTDDTIFNKSLVKEHGLRNEGEDGYRFGKNSLSDWNVSNIRDDEDWVADAHKVAMKVCEAKKSNPNEPIKIIGFSRGAALALVIAKFLGECGCCDGVPCWSSTGDSYERDKKGCGCGCKAVDVDFLGLVDPVSSDATGAVGGVGMFGFPFLGPIPPLIGAGCAVLIQDDDDGFVPSKIPSNVKKHLVVRASGWSAAERAAMGQHGIDGATEKSIDRTHAGGDKSISSTDAADDVLGALRGALNG